MIKKSSFILLFLLWCNLCFADTLGDTDGGASTDLGIDIIVSGPYTLSVNAVVTGISGKVFDNLSNSTWIGAIWADSTGTPGAKILEGSAIATSNTFQYYESSVASVSVSAQDIWIGGVLTASDGDDYISYDSSTPVNSYEKTGTSIPDPFGTGTLRSGRRYSVYITYTEATGARRVMLIT